MSEPFFTTNDSEFSRLEGLYIKERNPPAQITGVAQNTVGMAAECTRGPVGKTVDITSEARFLEVYGGRDYGSGGALINYGWLALLNKQFGKVVVARAAASDAVAASFTMEDNAGGATGTAIVRLDASSVGLWGSDVKFRVVNATNGNALHWNLDIKYNGAVTSYKNLNTQSGYNNLLATIGDDDGNLIVATKLANGRPCNTATISGADADGYISLGQTISGFTAVAGSNGTIADADFTGTGKALELLAAYKGLGAIFVAERMSSTIKSKMNTLAAAANQGLFLIGPDSGSTSVASAASEAASYRSDRIVYCFNHPYTLDPDDDTYVQTHATSWMAAILSQIDVDIHPGEEDTKKYTAGISRLSFPSLTREDYITLREAGICALEKDDGFAFVSGRTTSLTPGKEEITRRRMTDYLQTSAAAVLKYNVKKKNTESRRTAAAALLTAFCSDLAKAERIVDKLSNGKGAFSVDTEKLNTVAQRALGIEKILWRVKLIGHQLSLVLETEIGTGVTIEAAA